MYEKFGQFIDGKWQQAEKNETYDVINPATEEVIGKASKASSADVQKALKSAEKGLEIWKNTAPWQRAYTLRKIADLMRERKDVLAKWLTLEVGKPLAEVLEKLVVELIFLNGMQKRQKEFMVKHNKVDFQILECMFIISQLV
jgi:succinate-semialdehyde dehydrogenase/glutarate-semialdehyde dehydrogenase